MVQKALNMAKTINIIMICNVYLMTFTLERI